MSTAPNILHITCHDIGRHLHCYGIDAVKSPNFDRLAAAGTRFEQAFCTAPQCSPSRASLYTGRYPHSNGVLGLTHEPFGWELHQDEQHLTHVLKQNGYTAAGAGIIHETATLDRIGFDRIIAPDGMRAGPLTDAVLDYINTVKDSTRPFYLQVGYMEPHRLEYGFGAAPYDADGVYIPPYLVDEFSAREDLAYFQGAIHMVDEAFGRILDYLDAEALADETLIIFTADHGIPYPRAKCSLYDPGLEVALILRGPRIPANFSTAAMVSNIDVFPTLLDLLGLPIPEAVQGQSLLPLLRGEVTSLHEMIYGEITFHDYPDPRRCVRTATHKLILNFTNAPAFMNPSQTWRPPTITKHPRRPGRATHPPLELYDLQTDPLEVTNLADHPEQMHIQNRLLNDLNQWMVDTNDPLLEGIPASPSHRKAMKLMHSARS